PAAIVFNDAGHA
ncbi:unnamed protein product, partial [Adineta steineri]